MPIAPAKSTTWVSLLILSTIACTTAGARAHDTAVDRTVRPPPAQPTFWPIPEFYPRNATPPPFEPVTRIHRRDSDTELLNCRTVRFNLRSVRRSDELS